MRSPLWASGNRLDRAIGRRKLSANCDPVTGWNVKVGFCCSYALPLPLRNVLIGAFGNLPKPPVTFRCS